MRRLVRDDVDGLTGCRDEEGGDGEKSATSSSSSLNQMSSSKEASERTHPEAVTTVSTPRTFPIPDDPTAMDAPPPPPPLPDKDALIVR